MFTKAPTTIQLAIQSLATHILPVDDTELYLFIKKSIYNAQEVMIGMAR